MYNDFAVVLIFRICFDEKEIFLFSIRLNFYIVSSNCSYPFDDRWLQPAGVAAWLQPAGVAAWC